MAPSFSVADLKSRASKAKDLTVSKFSDTRDRYYASTPSKQLDTTNSMNSDYHRSKPSKPPPPPTRSSQPLLVPPSISGPAANPPPVPRRTRPDTSPSPSASPPIPPETEPKSIDWANLSPEDKVVFFSWLDEFFAGYLNKPVSPPNNMPPNNMSSLRSASTFIASGKSWTPSGVKAVSPPVTLGPPKIATWSKPQISSNSNSVVAGSLPLYHLSNNSNSLSDGLVMTYPPQSTHGSAALDIAHYFSPSTHWDSAWYSTDPGNPPFIAYGDNWEFMGKISGTQKEHCYGVFCRDLSLCWVTIGFSPIGSSDPNSVKRSARYLPPPRPLDKQSLIDAHKMYGETIASFAEGYVASQQYCGRGECWDLAADALKLFEHVPKPIPSIAKTHGHLIVWFRAEHGRQTGKWFGGDDRVRRGDIVQLRSVKIVAKVLESGTFTTSSSGPDHTSIVVSDTVPSKTPRDGQTLRPDEFGRLDVVEQSIGTSMLPKRQHYEMKGMETGEVWIYRPIGMKAFLGTELTARCPEDINTLTL